MEKGHLNILYTGGMSWGDSPSETFDLIADLEESGGIMEAIGFYQDDHDYKELLMKVLSLHKQICPTLLGLDPTLDKIVSDLLRKVPKKKRRSK